MNCLHVQQFVNLRHFPETLRVPVCAAAFSCRQPGPFSPGKVQTVAEEFHKDYGFCGSGEKFRKGTAEGNGHDLFRGASPPRTVRIQEPKESHTNFGSIAERI